MYTLTIVILNYGLGLYLTKRIVNLLVETISVESEVGKGSDFNFTISIHMGNSVK